MAQVGPIEVLITTTSDVERALAQRDTWVLRFSAGAFLLGAFLGAVLHWMAGRL